MSNATVQTLGSLENAQAIAGRVERAVPAYRQFICQREWTPGNPFPARPAMDKASYLLAFPFDQLVGEDFEQTFTIFKSSGSSGHSFYWPQLKDAHRSSAEFLRRYLEQAFEVHQKKTLAIVGLALGSWIGGEHFSWVLKSMAVTAPYPFSVFSPGSYHDEIIEMSRHAGKYVDQILLVVCPSAIGHILLRAEQSGRPLPLEKMRYLVLGEPFTENLRRSLQTRAGLAESANIMFSVYGSADTGALGVESPVSVALRKLLTTNEALAQALGFGAGGIPHLFHCAAQDAFLESVEGELLVTRWQGIPLVRYNLHDSVRLLCWAKVREQVLNHPGPDSSSERVFRNLIEQAGADLPDLIAIAGRADACLILCGTNVSESMLDSAVKSDNLAAYLTGLYYARIIEDDGRQLLAFDLELKDGVSNNAATADAIYTRLVQALGREQPEFLDDWRNVYSTWDADPQRRILRLNCLPYPALSQRLEKDIKQRGIRK
jgi:phenylacetate-CoA ligase